jgi:hypothetical protein
VGRLYDDRASYALQKTKSKMSIPTEIFCYPATLDDVLKLLENYKAKLNHIKIHAPWEYGSVHILIELISEIETSAEEYLTDSIRKSLENFDVLLF